MPNRDTVCHIRAGVVLKSIQEGTHSHVPHHNWMHQFGERGGMSLSLVQSRALLGLEAAQVTVEVHLANGLPSFTLVGLADVEVKEAR